MMVPESVAKEILAALEPMMYDDANQDNALAIYVTANATVGFQEIEDYSSDDPVTGAIGWSVLVDIDRAPDKVLPWLAQLVGVSLISGMAPADQRQQIKDLASYKRGTVDAMRNAPLPYLTGNKTVVFRERFGGPHKLTVITYTSETPDSNAVLAALIRQKPARIVMTYEVHDGQDFESLFVNNATFQDVYIKYSTMYGILSDQPGV